MYQILQRFLQLSCSVISRIRNESIHLKLLFNKAPVKQIIQDLSKNSTALRTDNRYFEGPEKIFKLFKKQTYEFRFIFGEFLIWLTESGKKSQSVWDTIQV